MLHHHNSASRVAITPAYHARGPGFKAHSLQAFYALNYGEILCALCEQIHALPLFLVLTATLDQFGRNHNTDTNERWKQIKKIWGQTTELMHNLPIRLLYLQVLLWPYLYTQRISTVAVSIKFCPSMNLIILVIQAYSPAE